MDYENQTVLKVPRGCCVYMLFDGEEVVYVGRTTVGDNVLQRLGQHVAKGWVFDTAVFVPTDQKTAANDEKSLIRQHDPTRYNVGSTAKDPRRRTVRDYSFGAVEERGDEDEKE